MDPIFQKAPNLEKYHRSTQEMNIGIDECISYVTTRTFKVEITETLRRGGG
ncbi:hypothetical protein HanPSC8_Chr05g0211951 [Helianthus annuus]|nr:hypothetical protein HanPSC8_Chr05g0211951 [Helianthus annuus]